MDPSAEPSTVAEDPVAALRRELAALRADHQTKLDSLSIENAGQNERIQALEGKKEKEKKKKKKEKEKEKEKEEQSEEEQGKESTFQNWRSNLRSQMTMVFPYLILHHPHLSNDNDDLPFCHQCRSQPWRSTIRRKWIPFPSSWRNAPLHLNPDLTIDFGF